MSGQGLAIFCLIVMFIIGLLVAAIISLLGQVRNLTVALTTQRASRDMAAVMEEVDALWKTIRAQVLRDAAEAWLRVDSESERKKLSWTPVPPGASESMVVRWLLARADKIEGAANDTADD